MSVPAIRESSWRELRFRQLAAVLLSLACGGCHAGEREEADSLPSLVFESDYDFHGFICRGGAGRRIYSHIPPEVEPWTASVLRPDSYRVAMVGFGPSGRVGFSSTGQSARLFTALDHDVRVVELPATQNLRKPSFADNDEWAAVQCVEGLYLVRLKDHARFGVSGFRSLGEDVAKFSVGGRKVIIGAAEGGVRLFELGDEAPVEAMVVAEPGVSVDNATWLSDDSLALEVHGRGSVLWSLQDGAARLSTMPRVSGESVRSNAQLDNWPGVRGKLPASTSSWACRSDGRVLLGFENGDVVLTSVTELSIGHPPSTCVVKIGGQDPAFIWEPRTGRGVVSLELSVADVVEDATSSAAHLVITNHSDEALPAVSVHLAWARIFVGRIPAEESRTRNFRLSLPERIKLLQGLPPPVTATSGSGPLRISSSTVIRMPSQRLSGPAH